MHIRKPGINLNGLRFMIRIFQFLHLVLIVFIAAAYSWLITTLPSDDRWRVSMSAIVGTALAIWSALIFVALLRSSDGDTFKKRCLATYQRFLTKAPTLLSSTLVLALIAVFLVSIEVRYGEVEFASTTDQEVSVVLADDEKAPRTLLTIEPNKTMTVRLPVGQHSIYFAVANGSSSGGTPYRTRIVNVLPPWKKHDLQTEHVPEAPKYVAQ